MRPYSRSSSLTQTLALTLIVLVLTLTTVYGGEHKPVKPSQKDKCPVCGMFVAKYSDFLAEVIFMDRSTFFFDGTKDMFKYYLKMSTRAII